MTKVVVLKEKELLTLNRETKILTRQDNYKKLLAKLIVRGSTKDMRDTPLVPISSVSQRRSGVYTVVNSGLNIFLFTKKCSTFFDVGGVEHSLTIT